MAVEDEEFAGGNTGSAGNETGSALDGGGGSLGNIEDVVDDNKAGTGVGRGIEGRAQVLDGQARDAVHDGEAGTGSDAAEGGEAAVLVVEVAGVIGQVEEPLVGGAVGVVPEFGHGDGAASIGDLVLVNYCGVFGNDGGDAIYQLKTAALDDKAGDGAVEDGVGVRAFVDVIEEVGDGGGRDVGCQSDVDIADVGLKADLGRRGSLRADGRGRKTKDGY